MTFGICLFRGNDSLIGTASAWPAQQSKAGYKDPSSNDEKEQPLSVGLASRGQLEGIAVTEDEGMGDADDEDFTDSEVLAFVKRTDAIKDRSIGEKAQLEDQSQKTPVAAITDCSCPSEELISSPPHCSFSVFKAQPDDFDVSPRKPLAQNHQRNVEPPKGHVPERMSPQAKEKKQKVALYFQ